jgi:isopenicillin-N epimerase
VSRPPAFTPEEEALSGLWLHSDGLVQLNHGSFGACPRSVLDYRCQLLQRCESDPMGFLLDEYPVLLKAVTQRLEEFTGAEPGSVVMVTNATTGMNTILRNLSLKPGDRILVIDQEYFATANATTTIACEKGAVPVKVRLPRRNMTRQSVLDAFESALCPGVKYAVTDHIVSATGAVLPLEDIIGMLSSRGVETVVDGAHGPGQVHLDLASLGCLAYTGNCHKWLCAPRSSAILYVRPDFAGGFLPLVTSHLPSDFETDMSDYGIRFMWSGTPDPTPPLSAGYACDYIGSLLEGGWPRVMRRNREMVLTAGKLICDATGLEAVTREELTGSMLSFVLPDEGISPVPRGPEWIDPLQKWLRQAKGIVAPVIRLGESGRVLRISSQLYNTPDQYRYLADSLIEYRKNRHVVYSL